MLRHTPDLTIALSQTEIQQIAQAAPGSVWYVGGEPNVISSVGSAEMTAIIEKLHYYYTEIRAADPTARITSPSLLNWEFVCNNTCAGYARGKDWAVEFRLQYLSRYGAEPPVDIWAIDVYPLDWAHLPTTNSAIPLSQITGLREYLNSVPALASKPIWVTELSLHWGWDAHAENVPGCTTWAPAGTYRTAEVISYLETVYSWLETFSDTMKVEKWFTFITYVDIWHCRSDGFAGLSLFDGPSPGASLTAVGQFYKLRSSP